MMPSLFLFSFAAPDVMMTGGAVFAMLCGIVLMGGQSVVGLPLRALSNLRSRAVPRKTVVCLTLSSVDRMHEQDLRGAEQPLQRAA